jgi:hypothetical protein
MEFYDFEDYAETDYDFEGVYSASPESVREKEESDRDETYMNFSPSSGSLSSKPKRSLFNRELGVKPVGPDTDTIEDIIKTKIVDSFVNIDSRNRDTKMYPDVNNYEIELDREYTNVKEIRVVSSQIPNMNKNVFSDPLVLRNNCMYWQVFSTSCRVLKNYQMMDEQKTLIFLDDVDGDIVEALFCYNTDRYPREASASNCLAQEQSSAFYDILASNRQNSESFNLRFSDIFLPAEAEEVRKRYVHRYQANKTLKVLRNERVGGYYNALDFLVNFTYWGPEIRDCDVQLAILCIRNSLNGVYNRLGQNHAHDKVYPCGYLQVMDDATQVNNTFETQMVEISSGLYDDSRLSAELTGKMSQSSFLTRALINEFKNETRFRCFRRRLLTEGAIYCSKYSMSLLERAFSGRKPFIVIIKYLNHGLPQDALITYEKYSAAGVSSGAGTETMIRASMYGRSFRVHSFHARVTGDKIHGHDILAMQGLDEFYLTDGAVFPVSHNYFYIDLEEVYDREFCQNMFASLPDNYGMSPVSRIGGHDARSRASARPPMSGLGDIIVYHEKIKIIMNAPYTMDKMLGMAPMDSADYFTKKVRVARVETKENGQIIYYLTCPNHNLIDGDKIHVNRKVELVVRYLDEDNFTVVSAERVQLLDEWRKESGLFFNLTPVTLLYNEFNISAADVFYTDDSRVYFSFRDLRQAAMFLEDFILPNNIFQCLQYGEPCLSIVYAYQVDGSVQFAVVSLLDDKLVKGFFGDIPSQPEESVSPALVTFRLSQKKIVCLHYYNHMLLTGVNDIMLSGYVPLQGESIIVYKRDKDNFFIVSRYASDDLVYKKYTVDPFKLFFTSDYQGFCTEASNLNIFGESDYNIMFEGYPYMICCSKNIGGNVNNVCHDYSKDALQNIFCKFNLPDKLTKETKMVFDRHAQTVRTFSPTPLPSLKRVDFSFFFANGLPYHFQNVDHSLVLLIREYVDTSPGVNISSRRGNSDDINVFQSKRTVLVDNRARK